MRIEQIDEPISVLAVFSGGAAEPKRFQWNGRSYKVDRVNAHWVDRRHEGPRLCYSVQAGEETYYLHLATNETQWWLDQVVLAG